MKTIQVHLPDHVHEKVKDLAKEEGISMNNFIVSLISNEVVRQEIGDFFTTAASIFDPQKFAEALAAIRGAPTLESDRI